MSAHSLVGRFGYQAYSAESDARGYPTPESLEATYRQVLSEVGASHHLVQQEGEAFARIVDNDELARSHWWPDRAGAVAAFDAQKARMIAEKD